MSVSSVEVFGCCWLRVAVDLWNGISFCYSGSRGHQELRFANGDARLKENAGKLQICSWQAFVVEGPCVEQNVAMGLDACGREVQNSLRILASI